MDGPGLPGNPLVETPNLDRLAKQGMRFTDAYAAAPVCSPTRCAVLTGQAPARIGLTTHLPGLFLPQGRASLTRQAHPQLNTGTPDHSGEDEGGGLCLGFFGKWHIAPSSGKGGSSRSGFPDRQGFDLNLGGTSYGGPPSFFFPYRNAELPDGPRANTCPTVWSTKQSALPKQTRTGHGWHICGFTAHWPMQASRSCSKICRPKRAWSGRTPVTEP